MKGKVFVQGDFMNAATYRLMTDYGFSKTRDINEADCVVYTGGADINPSIYDEPNVASYFNARRDKDDLAAIEASKGKFLVGICRGAQLLNCKPNGGTLWQDIDRHGGGYHKVHDLVTNTDHITNSLHHQGMRINEKVGGVLVGYTQLSTYKKAARDKWTREDYNTGGVFHYSDVDAEVVWYPDTKSLLFQGHPEFRDKSTTEYFYELMNRYYKAA